jgi:hypothetical protein
MRHIAAISVPALMALSLAACSGAEPTDTASTATTEETLAPAASVPEDVPSEAAPASSATPSARVLGLEGLGALRIGQPVPKGSSWAERGAQTGDACRTVTSPDYPGVYAIVEEGAVRRITLGQRSTVKLAEGIGVSASEADVKKWFAGFREEPHKYEAAPAKYLTAPNARPGESALRFEIKVDGKVGLIHVGEMPTLAYVEGCS